MSEYPEQPTDSDQFFVDDAELDKIEVPITQGQRRTPQLIHIGGSRPRLTTEGFLDFAELHQAEHRFVLFSLLTLGIYQEQWFLKAGKMLGFSRFRIGAGKGLLVQLIIDKVNEKGDQEGFPQLDSGRYALWGNYSILILIIPLLIMSFILNSFYFDYFSSPPIALYMVAFFIVLLLYICLDTLYLLPIIRRVNEIYARQQAE